MTKKGTQQDRPPSEGMEVREGPRHEPVQEKRSTEKLNVRGPKKKKRKPDQQRLRRKTPRGKGGKDKNRQSWADGGENIRSRKGEIEIVRPKVFVEEKRRKDNNPPSETAEDGNYDGDERRVNDITKKRVRVGKKTPNKGKSVRGEEGWVTAQCEGGKNKRDRGRPQQEGGD